MDDEKLKDITERMLDYIEGHGYISGKIEIDFSCPKRDVNGKYNSHPCESIFPIVMANKNPKPY